MCTQILLDLLFNALFELCQPIEDATSCFYNVEAGNIDQQETAEKFTETLI